MPDALPDVVPDAAMDTLGDPHPALTAKWTKALPEVAHLWDAYDGVWAIKEIEGLRVAVLPLMFSAAVIVGDPHVLTAYRDRWCYETVAGAFAAAREWSGPYPGTEPAGWHRHPSTGRRRPGGEPAGEYVAL